MRMQQNTSQKITIASGFLGDFLNTIVCVFSIFFIPLEKYNLFSVQNYVLLVSNFICFLSFVVLFTVEILRELWMVKHFDYSKKYSSLHLTTYRERYPHIFNKLSEMNLKYFITYKTTRIIFYINHTITCFVLLYFYYLSYQTITSLFINFWFCHGKLTKGLQVAKDSIENNIGYSYYNTVNMSFNRIDPGFKRHYSTSNPESNSDSLNASFNNTIETTRL